MEYSIAEVTKRFEVNASTLRYYETIGLLTDVARSKSGYRIYEDKHIDRLEAISCFKQAGMSIAEIQRFFEYEADIPNNIDNMVSLLDSRSHQILSDFTELFSSYTHILRKVSYYNDMKNHLKTGTKNPSWNDNTDEDFIDEAFSNIKNAIDLK